MLSDDGYLHGPGVDAPGVPLKTHQPWEKKQMKNKMLPSTVTAVRNTYFRKISGAPALYFWVGGTQFWGDVEAFWRNALQLE